MSRWGRATTAAALIKRITAQVQATSRFASTGPFASHELNIIQCCTYGTCKVGSTSGKCLPTAKCGGKSTPGHCPGPDNVQCCTEEEDFGTCTPFSGVKGICQDDSKACGASYVSGKCPGGANVRCCPQYGSCSVNGVSGTCQQTSKSCGGQYTSGHCPGPANVQCCTAKSSGGSPPPPSSGCGTPSINAAAVSLIQKWEGYVPTPSKSPWPQISLHH